MKEKKMKKIEREVKKVKKEHKAIKKEHKMIENDPLKAKKVKDKSKGYRK